VTSTSNTRLVFDPIARAPSSGVLGIFAAQLYVTLSVLSSRWLPVQEQKSR